MPTRSELHTSAEIANGDAKMEKTDYCNDLANRLSSLRDALSRQALPEPSTLEASRQQNLLKQKVVALQELVTQALERVEALRSSTDPAWESARADLDRRWDEILTLQKQLY